MLTHEKIRPAITIHTIQSTVQQCGTAHLPRQQGVGMASHQLTLPRPHRRRRGARHAAWRVEETAAHQQPARHLTGQRPQGPCRAPSLLAGFRSRQPGPQGGVIEKPLQRSRACDCVLHRGIDLPITVKLARAIQRTYPRLPLTAPHASSGSSTIPVRI